MAGYTSIRDMFDGGGPGQSGDEFGGALGGVSNSVGLSPRGSSSSSSSSSSSRSTSSSSGSSGGSGYTGIRDMFDGGGPGASGGRHQGGGLLSTIANTASSAAGGYSNIRDLADGGGPGASGDEFGGALGGISNTLGLKPSDGDPATRDIGNRLGGIIGGALMGLPGSLIGRLIGGGKINLGLDGTQREGERDRQIQAIANDNSLTDRQKQEQVRRVVAEAAAETVAEQQNASGATGSVAAMAEQIYGMGNAQPLPDGVQGQSDAAATGPQAPQSILDDPAAFLAGNGGTLSGGTPTMDASASGTVIGDVNASDPSATNITAQTAASQDPVMTSPNQAAASYDAATAADRVATSGQATAQQGQVSDQSVIEAEQADIEATASGDNAVGEALSSAATQNISTVIDTSTVSGKLLAQELGEGNYTDAKSTVQGQLEILSKQFTDPTTGEPKIPSWAAGVARNVSRIAAFKGMTGTAATAAMSQALMEASLPIAQQDAQFFQSVSMENLGNRQQMAVQKAQVLSNLQLANLDARMTAAVENSRSFLQMDLANLDNAQQAEIVNTQARVQSILEDAKTENAARMFRAESQNDFTKFYEQMNTQINLFNAEQKNAMERFNAGEINAVNQFNAQLENQREQFYRDMQYNVDLANARWRQSVETVNTEMQFQAAQTDVKNIVDLSTESLNRIWDREDGILAYTWKTTENELDREIDTYRIDKTSSIEQARVDMERDEREGEAAMGWLNMGIDAINGDGRFLGYDLSFW